MVPDKGDLLEENQTFQLEIPAFKTKSIISSSVIYVKLISYLVSGHANFAVLHSHLHLLSFLETRTPLTL